MGENIKTYILDASAVLTLLLPDEAHLPLAKKYLQLITNHDNKFLSIPLLEIEVANAIRSAVKSKRLETENAQKVFQQLKKFPIEYKDANIGKALDTALNDNLSVYDALYVVFSRETKATLLSEDQKLVTLLSKAS